MENNIDDYAIGINKPSKTIVKQVGCGKIYCIFVEHHNGNFDKMLIRGSMSRNTNCGDSWLWGLGSLLTFSLRRAMKEEGDSVERGIVRQLFHHTCSIGSIKTERSCISAIGKAVETYIKTR